MESSGTAKVICTPRNFKRFSEKFKEENRGQGPYVAALGQDKPYVPQLPGMHDYSEVPNYGYDCNDPQYDPSSFTMEKIYRYVEPVEQSEIVIIPDPHPDAKEGATITREVRRVTNQWTPQGRIAFVRAQELAEKIGRDDRAKRDQCVARLLEQLSTESRTLLNNMKGAAQAINDNSLWLIFNELLPQSHNQVSTSAVAKRTRDLLSSVQSTSLPAFTESFALNAAQFINDWESPQHPGYIRADSLLRNVFVEAVRAGSESSLLQPSLEQISLHTGDHRTASLSTAQEYLSSFYIRNKPTTSVEETVAFKGSVDLPAPSAESCACCVKASRLPLSELVPLVSGMPRSPNLSKFLDSKGFPRYCRSCVITPLPCACGQPRTQAFHKFCAGCFKKQRAASKEAKANVAAAPSSTPDLPEVTKSASSTAPPGYVAPPPPMDSRYPPHPTPWPQSYPAYPGNHGYHASYSAPYPTYSHPPHPSYGRPPPSPEDDALSDYSSHGAPRGYFLRPDWEHFRVSEEYTRLCAELDEATFPPMAAVTLDLAHDQDSYYIDSGASMNCTDSLSHLTHVRPLKSPIILKGIGKGVVSFTHIGQLGWLPPWQA